MYCTYNLTIGHFMISCSYKICKFYIYGHMHDLYLDQIRSLNIYIIPRKIPIACIEIGD